MRDFAQLLKTAGPSICKESAYYTATSDHLAYGELLKTAGLSYLGSCLGSSSRLSFQKWHWSSIGPMNEHLPDRVDGPVSGRSLRTAYSYYHVYLNVHDDLIKGASA